MKKLEELEEKIGYQFKNKNLLLNAFVHRSYLNEHKNFPLPSNEKLEFLGDSVLSLITAIYLYRSYPKLHEGEYTDVKSALVSSETLFEAAKKLNLGEFLFLSKGEKKSGGKNNRNILADCFEALVAAIFLDGGFEVAYQFVIKNLFEKRVDQIVKNRLFLSAKNRLQEYFQGKYKKLPFYKILKEEGPAHNRKYTAGVYFDGKELGRGEGKSKKEAEEKAAISALKNLKIF